MNHVMKKRGVPDIASGTPPRSVCGILCGQQKSVKSYSFKKLQKAKENTRNPKISGVVLELLGGFEPPTSSLPIIPGPIIACCNLLCFVARINCGTRLSRFYPVIVYRNVLPLDVAPFSLYVAPFVAPNRKGQGSLPGPLCFVNFRPASTAASRPPCGSQGRFWGRP